MHKLDSFITGGWKGKIIVVFQLLSVFSFSVCLYLLIAQVCINEPRDHCSLEGRQISWIICLNAAPGYVSSGSAGLEIQLSWASFAW